LLIRLFSLKNPVIFRDLAIRVWWWPFAGIAAWWSMPCVPIHVPLMMAIAILPSVPMMIIVMPLFGQSLQILRQLVNLPWVYPMAMVAAGHASD